MESAGVADVVEVGVDVVVDGVVVDHLGDGDVDEAAGAGDPAQVDGEDLHEHCFADADASLQENVFVQLVSSFGEDFFAEWRAVEIVEEEADHLTVVFVNDEFAALGGKDGVGNMEEEVGMCAIDFGVSDLGECLGCFVCVLLHSMGDFLQCLPCVEGPAFGFESVEEAAVPLGIACGLLSVFGQFLGQAGGIDGHGSDIFASEASLIGVVVGPGFWFRGGVLGGFVDFPHP